MGRLVLFDFLSILMPFSRLSMVVLGFHFGLVWLLGVFFWNFRVSLFVWCHFSLISHLVFILIFFWFVGFLCLFWSLDVVGIEVFLGVLFCVWLLHGAFLSEYYSVNFSPFCYSSCYIKLFLTYADCQLSGIWIGPSISIPHTDTYGGFVCLTNPYSNICVWGRSIYCPVVFLCNFSSFLKSNIILDSFWQ